MKILILCDHYPVSPRLEKVRKSLIKLYPDYTINIFAWNRSNKNVVEDYITTFTQDIGYGKKLSKLVNLFKFAKATREHVFDFKPDYIHAIDIEMLIISALISKKTKLVYEVYDIKFFRNKFMNWIREKVELFIMKTYTYAIILASPYFNIYYKEKGIQNAKTVIINNKPSNEHETETKSNYMNSYEKLLKDKIVVGFIGAIRYRDVLVNLIDACKELDNMIVLLAGDGPDSKYIENYINKSALNSKVIMTGRYSSRDFKAIYESCDYVWAAYPNENLNVKYAISNKFFESIVFSKKIIVSERTMLGNYVEEKDIGYTVNPYSVEKILMLLRLLKKHNKYGSDVKYGDGVYWEDEEGKLLTIYDKVTRDPYSMTNSFKNR